MNATLVGEPQVTIYRKDFALVREDREVELKQGNNIVLAENVAPSLIPTSVSVEVSSGGKFAPVREQLPEFAGEGRNPRRASLHFLLHAPKAGTYRMQLSYMVTDLAWDAEYVILVGANERILDLTCWMDVRNSSDYRLDAAKVAFMAGELSHREPGEAKEVGRKPPLKYGPDTSRDEDHHYRSFSRYQLARSTAIVPNAAKQISFFSAAGLKTKRLIVFDMRRTEWFGRYASLQHVTNDSKVTEDARQAVVLLEVDNVEDNGMGIDLPAGRVRVYRKNESGALEFLGEDALNHSNPGGRIRLFVGEEPGVFGSWTLSDSKAKTRGIYDEEYQVRLRNNLERDVEVLVIEHPPGDWQVLDSSHAHETIEASTIQFAVALKAGSYATLKYRVRVSRG